MIRSKDDGRIWLRSFVGRYPAIYYALAMLRPRIRGHLVRRDTELVIEGFPRSANSFAYEAFLAGQRGPVRVAHHLHVPAQILRALAWRIPALVLIRQPVDVAVSYWIMAPDTSPRTILRAYASFYERLKPYREEFVTATFEDATQRFPDVMRVVNAKFGRSFGVPALDAQSLRAIFDRLKHTNDALGAGAPSAAYPSAWRDRLKGEVRARVCAAENAAALARAESVYARFVEEIDWHMARPAESRRHRVA